MLGDIKPSLCLGLTPMLKKSKYLNSRLIYCRSIIPVQALFETLGQIKNEPIIQTVPPIYSNIYSSTQMAQNKNMVGS